jgi:preprotein translocase SecF subunit
VFHLTRYKYWFFLISGLVILPGLLALIVWHLNLGIDFTGGSVIEVRFANAGINTTDVANAFTAVGGRDVQVFVATDLSSSAKPSQYVYIAFDRPIDNTFVNAVTDKLKNAGLGQINRVEATFNTVTPPGGGNPTSLMVVSFQQPVNADVVKGALKNLPETGPAPATTDATATPQAGKTPSPTPSGQNNQSSAKYPVNVASVQVGQNDSTYRVETQTFLDVANVDKAVFALQAKYGPAYVVTKDTVGASIGLETTLNAIWAVVFASLAILVYIAFAFRKVGSWAQSTRFGTCAIIALLHDVLVVLGLWAIFGHLFDFKVDTLFLTAVLTVIGFSVHDTIVVFDRIRENLRRRTSESFEQITDASLIQTMSRSINTSFTVLLTLAALTLFGGESIREFTLALLIGILSGTYSSIFNASMLLVVWETGEWRTWFKPRSKAVAPATGRALAGSRS